MSHFDTLMHFEASNMPFREKGLHEALNRELGRKRKKWIYPIIQQATTAPVGRWGSLAFCHQKKPKESCSLLSQPYGNEALSCSMVKAALTAALLYS